jgi:predicted neutral ceramidase superfamily lipid hydrolase
MMRPINWRQVLLSLILALAVATILDIIIVNIFGGGLPLGKAWFIVFISIFIVYYFIAMEDKRIDRTEITTMLFIAALLFLMGWVMKRFIPEIFSVLPKAMQNLFSALGGP